MVDFANRSKRVRGDVAERLKALDSKSSIGETLSEVRILPSPPVQNTAIRRLFCWAEMRKCSEALSWRIRSRSPIFVSGSAENKWETGTDRVTVEIPPISI